MQGRSAAFQAPGHPNFGDKCERRRKYRFQLQADVRYAVIQSRGQLVSGSGKTLNISSEGILFTTSAPLQPKRLVQIALDWPAKLHETCPLQLMIVGRVVRSDNNTAAVGIERYEFRNRALKALVAGA